MPVNIKLIIPIIVVIVVVVAAVLLLMPKESGLVEETTPIEQTETTPTSPITTPAQQEEKLYEIFERSIKATLKKTEPGEPGDYKLEIRYDAVRYRGDISVIITKITISDIYESITKEKTENALLATTSRPHLCTIYLTEEEYNRLFAEMEVITVVFHVRVGDRTETVKYYVRVQMPGVPTTTRPGEIPVW
ncbi:MAG: hypothetical protein QW558_03630 [Desulfurococcaceae archaeon]